MRGKTEGRSVNNKRVLIALLLLALFAPSIVGFQYLVWLTGGTHLTFAISSTTWNLTYSDWYTEFSGAINGWLFRTIIWPLDLLLGVIFLASGRVSPLSLLGLLVTPIVRLQFAVVVVRYRQMKLSKSVLTISSMSLIGVSLASCLLPMTINAIFGVPPGVWISIVAPDVDTRFFIPIPILLLVGLYLSKKSGQTC